MAFAAGAAVTLPTLGALSTIAYYSKHPDDGTNKRRRSSFLSTDSRREFHVDDDPSEFSSFTSSPAMEEHVGRRKSAPTMLPWASDVKPDYTLLEDPQLQVWRDRYKWGRNYGMNFAHNEK
ncbi:hypothetical protein IWW50_005381 [Coemansia erecta]|nr:hypothetical protein GGF43_005326 [Coemansia sp. RSA 2618]KAJ2819660.1 hypothetical protein IWW50_005381 [Coemansia erecta]